MSLGNALRIVLNKNKKYCIQEIQVILQCIQNDDDEENNTELIIKKINEDVNDNDDNNNNVVDGANNNKTLLLVLSAAIEQWNCYLESNNNKSKKYIKYAKGIIRILIQQYEKQCKQYLIDHLLLLLKTSTRITNEDNNNTDKINTAVDSTTLTPPTSTSYKMVVYEILKLKYITIHDNNEKQRIIIELKQLSEILFRKQQNYIKAIDILTFIIDELLIIKGDQPHALLLSNRAACYLQVKEFVNCINDCTNGLLILNEIQDGNVNHNNNINSNNNKARRKDEIIFYKINKIKLHVRRASAVVDLVMNSSSSSSINNGNNNGDLKYTINNAIDDHDEALNLLNTLNDSILKTLLPLLLDLNKVNTLCNTMKLKVQADQLFRNASNNNNNNNNNNDDGRNSMSNIHENDKVNSNNNKNNHNSNNNNNNNQRNKIFNAYNIYSSILKDVPTYISVLNNRASASLAIGKFNEAINDTSFALELLKFKEDEEGCITSSDVKKKIANDGNNNNNQQRNLVIIGYYPSKVNNMQEYNSWIIKILAKRGAAYVQLQQYQNAFNDYKICVSLDATNDMKLKQDLENVALKL